MTKYKYYAVATIGVIPPENRTFCHDLVIINRVTSDTVAKSRAARLYRIKYPEAIIKNQLALEINDD